MSKRMMAMLVAVAVGVLQPAFEPVLRAQGPKEGIKVHGHWAIDVRQPDGTPVSHTEFENALLPTGGVLLATILGRENRMGRWIVWLPTGPCHPQGSPESWCRLQEPPLVEVGTGNLATLQVATDFLTGNVTLSGSFTALRTGDIRRVETMARVCWNDGVTANCDAVTNPEHRAVAPFSGTNLPPVAVANGQIVQITVTLSFS